MRVNTLTRLLAAAMAAAFATQAFCQVGVADSGRENLAVNPSSNAINAYHQTNLQTAAPISYSDSWSTTGDGATLSGELYDSADYGYLTAGSKGSATNSLSTGAYVYGNVYGSAYNAEFHDTITANEAMTLDLDYRVTDVSSAISSWQPSSTYANLKGILIVNSETDLSFTQSGTQDAMLSISLTAGQTIPIFATLAISCSAYSNVDTLINTATYSLDSTARLFITNETAGTTYRTGSGHVYQSVPEPSEFGFGAMCILGLVSLKRRRK